MVSITIWRSKTCYEYSGRKVEPQSLSILSWHGGKQRKFIHI